MRLGKIAFLLLTLIIKALAVEPVRASDGYANFQANVLRIVDGDTFVVLYRGQQLKIRLAHIDCPERLRHQPFADQATATLRKLCLSQPVIIHGLYFDRYHRLIAEVINGQQQLINQELIRLGMAWHFKKYSGDPVYAQLETIARKKRIGLWSAPHPLPPWIWRARRDLQKALIDM